MKLLLAAGLTALLASAEVAGAMNQDGVPAILPLRDRKPIMDNWVKLRRSSGMVHLCALKVDQASFAIPVEC